VKVSASAAAVEEARSFCREVLPAVSRTFALNIPVLPPPLDLCVTVAYLLCRIADTVEDEARGAAPERKALLEELARLTTLPADVAVAAERFARSASASLRPEAPEAEVRLLKGTGRVLEALASLPAPVHGPIATCVRDMAGGMGEVVSRAQARPSMGLLNLEELLEYCYYVAGTVGEMLTRLFLWHAPDLEAAQETVQRRAVAFGRALQLTNILKDVREDLDRGDCWLPLDVLARHGLTPETLLRPALRGQAVAALDELVGVAHGEVISAFEYILALPKDEKGMRLFCLWPLFMAVLTLRKLKGNAAVFEPAAVKIPRSAVTAVVALTSALASRNRPLSFMFTSLTQGLPPPPHPAAAE
jgi:farnesyl-diphosphate farnesyltransferase